MAIHLIGTPMIAHSRLTAQIAPHCVARLSAAELHDEDKSVFNQLNARLLRFEQKLLAEVAAICQKLSDVSLLNTADFRAEAQLYFCLHQDDPQFDEDDDNVLCVMTVDFVCDEKTSWCQLDLEVALKNDPDVRLDTDSSELWMGDSLRVQHELAAEPHSVLLHHLLGEVRQGERQHHYHRRSIGLLDILRIGEVFYQLIGTFGICEPLQLPYPSRLSQLAQNVEPYQTPCSLRRPCSIPFIARNTETGINDEA